MFSPNTTCERHRRQGFDKFGKPRFGAGARVGCAIVTLNLQAVQTSPRSETSATRANAEEAEAVARLLFPVAAGIAKGDRVVVRGSRLIVTAVEPRLDALGKHDHDDAMLALFEG